MLKNTFIIICLVILLSSAANADTGISVEAFYKNITLIDAKNQNGGGGTILIDMNSQTKAAFSGSYTAYKETSNIARKDFDVSYSHATYFIGILYEPPVEFLERHNFVWRNSLYGGYSRTEVKIEGLKDASAEDSGFAMALNTGIGYNLTQHIQLFADAGWQHSFYQGDLNDSNISGFQVFAGVRYSLSGSKSLEDY